MITLREIISNLSKGQSATAIRYVLQGMQENYEKIKNRIIIQGYQQDSNSTTFFFSIPSIDKPVSYDIVIWLKTKDKLLLDTEIKVFSNSPVFAYNFCFTFYQSGSLLYSEKYSNDFKLMPPRVRNPWQIHSFDKHIFAAILHIKEVGVNKIIETSQNRVPQIKTFDQKKEELDTISQLRRRRSNR